MKLSIELCMDNAAFEDCNADEANAILERMVISWGDENLGCGERGDLRDSNGNKVGSWQVTDEGDGISPDVADTIINGIEPLSQGGANCP